MPRFFVPPADIHADRFTLTGSEAHHALAVYRKKVGDELDLFDGQHTSFRGRIESILGDSLQGVVLERQTVASASSARTHLVAALIKGPRWDWLVQKASEVGVDVLIPVTTTRTIIHVDAGDASAKQKRWERIALEAAKQCGRTRPMDVQVPIPFSDALKRLPAHSCVLIPWEKENLVTIRQASISYKGRDAVIMVGPEGGWEASEVAQAKEAGALPVTLGPHLLRSETAGIVAAALLGETLREGFANE